NRGGRRHGGGRRRVGASPAAAAGAQRTTGSAAALPLLSVIRSAATQAFWLLSQTICSQALSALRPITSTCRPGASCPTGVLFVLGAGRTFGALPARAAPKNVPEGVPVPAGPGDAAAVTVASATAVEVPPFASVA